jgi:hypothetical protein
MNQGSFQTTALIPEQNDQSDLAENKRKVLL